jgi:hypothetical protein
MSLATSPADNQGNFERQRPQLEEGINAAKRLRDWLHDHQEVLRNWSEAVDAALAREVSGSR